MNVNNELQLLNDTIKSHKNDTNKDIAFLSLQLYKMIPSISKKEYIQLLKHTMSDKNATITYDNIQNLITNNYNVKICSQLSQISEPVKTQYLRITYSTNPYKYTSRNQNKHMIFDEKYRNKLASIVSVFLGYRPTYAPAHYSYVFAICAKYLNQIMSHMCKPDGNVFINTPLETLIYLYTGKTTAYLPKNQNDISTSNNHKYSIVPCVDTVDGKIFVATLFAQFNQDCIEINQSNIPYHRQSVHNICVSLFEYMSNSCKHSSQAEPFKWNFCYYIMKFLFEYELCFELQSEKPKSVGLFFQREICNKYDLKCGPYSGVKKIINKWAFEMFSPTIYGWWKWFNQTLNKWVPFPIELKQYFGIFNNAYSNSEYDVYAMDCHFKIKNVRRIGDFKMENENNSIPICINPCINEELDDVKMESDSIYSIFSTELVSSDRFKNQTNQLCPDDVKIDSTVKNSNRLVRWFVHELICSFADKYVLIPDIINIISKYLIAETLNVPLLDHNDNSSSVRLIRKTPLVVLCYLYGYKITNTVQKVICKNKNVSQLKHLLKSDGLLNPLKTLCYIQTMMPSQNVDIQLFFSALVHQYFSDIQCMKQAMKYTPKHLALILFKDIIHSTCASKCDDHCRFMILFYDFVKQQGCQHILRCNRGSVIVNTICGFFSINKSKKYHTAMDCIFNNFYINSIYNKFKKDP